jgi:VIT1/CCC1 family predicted Fe2+/Mn2+ transporter
MCPSSEASAGALHASGLDECRITNAAMHRYRGHHRLSHSHEIRSGWRSPWNDNRGAPSIRSVEVLSQAADAIVQNRENWISLMLEGEFGLSGVDPHPFKSVATTFTAFLAAGVVPLFPFLLGLEEALALSVAMTLVTFFGIGALKSHWSLNHWWRSGFETLLIGGGAAAIAYLVGTLFHA